MARRNKSEKKKSNTKFYVICLLIVLVVFAFIIIKNWNVISSNVKYLNAKISGNPVTELAVQDDPKEEKIPLGNEDLEEPSLGTTTISLVPEQKNEVVEKNPVENKISAEQTVKEEKPAEKSVEKKETPKAEEPKTEKTETKPVSKPVVSAQNTVKTQSVPATPAMTELQLCFIYLNSDGRVERRIVKRSVPKSDSPLTDALNLLLRGPDTTLSAEKNLNTYITPSAKLLSAKVKDGVAYLNFNEDFCFNSDGNVGILNQLMQIVYTATTFSTVNSVQFQIEGKVEEYIGDGIWVGTPLSKMSF